MLEESLEGHGGGFFKAKIRQHGFRPQLPSTTYFFVFFQPQQTPRIYKAALSNDETPQETLPVLDKIELNLTANKIFSWLQMKIK